MIGVFLLQDINEALTTDHIDPASFRVVKEVVRIANDFGGSYRTNTEYREDMVQILAEAERTSQLIDSLLLLARADAGEGGLQDELADVSTSVREAMEQARSLAAEKRIELTSNLSSDAVVVRGDGESLRRLFFLS
jgi:signal transduction histidine kinase